ncbi:unnamed protein product, partial [Phaeothamnion confervicola]
MPASEPAAQTSAQTRVNEAICTLRTSHSDQGAWRRLYDLLRTALKEKDSAVEMLCDGVEALAEFRAPSAPPLPPLAVERVAYHALARCIASGGFFAGLRVAAIFEASVRTLAHASEARQETDKTHPSQPRSLPPDDANKRRPAERRGTAVGGVSGGGDDNGSGCVLRAFCAPPADCSPVLAKLVGGAAVNASRCLFEAGGAAEFACLAGALSDSAASWLRRLAESDCAAAAHYAKHLYGLLWHAAEAADAPPLAEHCLALDCRAKALDFQFWEGTRLRDASSSRDGAGSVGRDGGNSGGGDGGDGGVGNSGGGADGVGDGADDSGDSGDARQRWDPSGYIASALRVAGAAQKHVHAGALPAKAVAAFCDARLEAIRHRTRNPHWPVIGNGSG